ncbi:hypothetical protein MTR_3g463030 [Medicago truncatula]|uniref:Uncharacterized protein n=1 Tax=Medicago truncatula TaxID=3880 RepID=A0A072UX88_MEDTR|nr:hypothetical protein MTR_3g463030 [Medicago truncatula]
MRVRTKHAEKTRVGLYGRSAMVKVVWDVTNHVTPTVDEGMGVISGAQGTTMSSSRQLIEEPNHIGMRGILRPCRYETTWLKEGCYKWYQSRPFQVRCSSGTNQAEAGGHATPTADEGKGVIAGAQGTTMSGSRHLIEEPNHIGRRGILRSCRYGTTWLKEGL